MIDSYLIIIEKTKSGFSAYSPDVPGCVAIGKTVPETEKNMKEAIQFHIEFMVEKGYQVPKPGRITVKQIPLPIIPSRKTGLGRVGI